MRRAAAIAFAAAVGAGFAVYLARERTPTSTTPADEAVPEPRAAPLAPEAAARAPPVDAPPAPATPSPPAGSTQPSEAASLPTAAAERDSGEPQPAVLGEHDDDFAQRYLQIAERFRGEARDPTTAVSLEREVLARLAALTGLEVTTLDVECRATTCRVRMTERPGAELKPLAGPGGFQNVVEGFGTVVSTLSEAPDGSTVFEWLLARDPP